MKRIIAFAIAALLFASPNFSIAQSTAQPVIPGYLTTTGCAYGQTSCFVPYGASGPSSTVTANQGAAGSAAWPFLSTDGNIVTLGSKADAAGGTGSQSLISLTKQLHLDLLAPLPVGTNAIGSITNTTFGISGTLPAFGSTPTFNCGTGCYQATQPVSGTVAATQSGIWGVTGGTPFGPVNVSPAVTASSYSANYAIGSTFNVTLAPTNGGGATVGSILVRSKSGQTPTAWLYAWTKSPAATCTDHTAFAQSATDIPYLVPGFPIQVTLTTTGLSGDTTSFATIANLNTAFNNQDTSPGKVLYGCLVYASGTMTPGSTSDISLNFVGWQ